MICEDILHMEGLEELSLVAGKKGLSRPLRWIYFADALECVGSDFMEDSESLGKWVNGGELIVITSERMTRNADRLMQFMRNAYEKEAAGLVINTGQIPPMIEGYANELGFPLYEISWQLKLVDLSQIICRAILTDETNETSLDQILYNLLYNGYDSEDTLAYQAQYFGFDLHQPCRIALFDLDHFSEYVKRQNTSEGEYRAIKKDLQAIIKHHFRINGVRKVMSMIQSDSVIVLFPAPAMQDEALRRCCGDILKRFSAQHNELTASVGIGNSYSLISEFNYSLKEASKAEKVSAMSKGPNHIMFFHEMGMLGVFAQIENEKVLVDYCQSVIGKLTALDTINGGDLLNTLRIYIQCNRNAALAAETLFIHRNTLRYRLNKIEQILETDLNDLQTCVDISNALRMKQYLSAVGSKE